MALVVKSLQETLIPALGRPPAEGNGNSLQCSWLEDAPWIETPGGLRSPGSQRARNNCVTEPACCTPHVLLSSPFKGFPGGSAGKQSACNAGDPGLIPGQEDPLEKG